MICETHVENAAMQVEVLPATMGTTAFIPLEAQWQGAVQA